MKLVKQSFEILKQEIPKSDIESFKEKYLEAMYKHIERCGKTCYRAEHNITEDSYKKFVQRMIDSHHYSVLEHGAIYLKMPAGGLFVLSQEHNFEDYIKNSHSKVSDPILENNYIVNRYITTNYRVIVENGWEEDLQYLCEPTKHHEKRYTVLLHSCIHVYKDLTRHRKMSFSIESTRYCKYSDTEHFGEMKFVLPPWVKEESTCKWWLKEKEHLHQPLRKTEEDLSDFSRIWYEIPMEDIERNCETGEYILLSKWNTTDMFLHGLKCVEDTYNLLIESGWQPQQAAEILPQATAADVVISGFISDWIYLFELRTSYIHKTGLAHPLVTEIINPLYNEFVDRGYINKLI